MELRQLAILILIGTLWGCRTTVRFSPGADAAVHLPYIKNSPNECYYLDEFMPVPNNLVTGRAGAMSLRYYSYNAAMYKDWPERYIVLAFYSNDDRCWSLFEESYVAD